MSYTAQFHYEYDEKKNRENIFSQLLNQDTVLTRQVHLWGQQDRIFEIEIVRENP
jgi:hypothetical protein